ncbi:MAG: hypothetical protein KatS3mg077_3085 [Candidatus Binatia bacterium]|nr:MAG: hypothetical protein KatS3mg077_3085 [Candidatus Binatia bacterium]
MLPDEKKSKNRMDEVAELSARAVQSNVKRLVELHQQLVEVLSPTGRRRPRFQSPTVKLQRAQNLRSVLVNLASAGRALSRVLSRATERRPEKWPLSGPDWSLIAALGHRIRRLSGALRERRRDRRKHRAK